MMVLILRFLPLINKDIMLINKIRASLTRVSVCYEIIYIGHIWNIPKCQFPLPCKYEDYAFLHYIITLCFQKDWVAG